MTILYFMKLLSSRKVKKGKERNKQQKLSSQSRLDPQMNYSSSQKRKMTFPSRIVRTENFHCFA